MPLSARVPSDFVGQEQGITPAEGVPSNDEIRTHANSEDFGGAIGKGLSDIGEVGQQTAHQYNGLIMETQANQAELGYIKSAGDLKAKYSQYEGLEAAAKQPEYETALVNLHNQYRSSLPILAQKMFDSNTIRSLGNQSSEYASYAAGEIKKANLTSHEALQTNAVSASGDLSTVLDDNRFGGQIGTIVHAQNAISDIKGDASIATGTDKDTGRLTFPDTPEGQAANARYTQQLDAKLAPLYTTAAKTVADNQGAGAAATWVQKHWDMMPDAAKVQMNAYLAPKVKNEFINGNVTNMNAQIDADYHAQMVANVPNSPTQLTQVQQNPLDVIRKNEGIGYSNDSKGEVINGLNSVAHPAEFSEAKNILDTQGQAAATKYVDGFFQKNILDKYNINSLPPSTQAIVADGLVNQGTGAFGQSLIKAAQNGSSPQQLIDMRRQEYQRLATSDPAQYGKYLDGWNKRLDGLEQTAGQVSGLPSYPNKADMLRANQEDYVNQVINKYLQQYPDDYYGARTQENRARMEINHQITMEDNKLKADRDNVIASILGQKTKGVVPSTYQELVAIPGMRPLLDKVRTEQPQFASQIDTMIAKASRRDETSNSPNGYDTILRTLEPYDGQHPNLIKDQGQLDGLLGKSDGTGINIKDYNDAKQVLEASDPWKSFLSENMKNIANANGNLDGQGQTRALNWFHSVNQMKKANDAKGDKAIPEDELIQNIKDGISGPRPSRMEQISNWAKGIWNGGVQSPQPQTNVPTATGADGTKYILQGGQWVKQQ